MEIALNLANGALFRVQSLMINSSVDLLIRTRMKFATALIVLIGTAVTSIQASPDLNVRAEHPLAQPPAIKNVHKRSCAVRQNGCEQGYCWNQCGSGGEWCWLALQGGKGDWVTCLQDSDCEFGEFRDAGCGICDKPNCGCSC